MSDLQLAVRALRATPVITLVVILSLAFGIGPNTAIFSLVDSLLLRALPVERPERLVSVEPNARSVWWNHPAWKEIRARRHDLFADALAFRTTRFNLSPRGPSDYVDGLMASGGFFDVLGVRAMLGRAFTEDDDRDGAGPHGPVAVLGYEFWRERFDGRADVIGRTLVVDRVPFTIVGVMPRGFFGAEVGRKFDVAVPIGTDRAIRGANTALDRAGVSWLRVLARLKDGQTLASAEQAFRGVQALIREASRNPDAPAAFREAHYSEPFRLEPAVMGYFANARHVSPAGHRRDDGRRARPADRLRQHREPVPRANCHTQARDQRASRARRPAMAHRAPTARRDSAPLRRGWPRRPLDRALVQPPARAAVVDADEYGVPRRPNRLAAAGVHDGRRRRGHAPRRTGAGSPRRQEQSDRRHARARPRHDHGSPLGARRRARCLPDCSVARPGRDRGPVQ
jgi:hypothetical protein